ncbi:TIGR04255 family protein [Cupriavidus sp. AcVe19-1a]|uniref:TIGR04255 family protein n=1 Tax=Cupriavidus sp. AcVe19-1a TaxID=2821359 RepID=UPI001AE767E9|nr:TIGR04255 family protein [Cupriavidus sp. AcVe19-1a]MBP0631976.1 TIGR04255 family protein [Cupriavidus sp. AcVe19-1a]
MADRNYPHAPITEAVIDVQVEFGSEPNNSTFSAVAETLSGQFPIVAPIHFMEINVTGATDQSPSHFKSSQLEVGLRLSSEKGDRVLQLQRRGFTYSHLPPYTSWDTFCREARALWDVFSTKLAPTVATRVAVRYINRIEILEERFELEKYFLLYPKLPEGIPQDISSCFMQIVMPQPDISGNASATLTFAAEPNPRPGATAFLLDFDVFSTCRVSPGSEEIWDTLALLRSRKNKLFEACITDATRERFQ